MNTAQSLQHALDGIAIGMSIVLGLPVLLAVWILATEYLRKRNRCRLGEPGQPQAVVPPNPTADDLETPMPAPAEPRRSSGYADGENPLYHQSWEPSEKVLKLYELARLYHLETESFDRTICTGPIRDGGVTPANPQELGITGRNARMVLSRLQEEAAVAGISRAELMDAIRRQA